MSTYKTCDSLGQLAGAAKFASGGAGKLLPGYQYNYQYDQIGNRTKTSTGGDQFGLNQRDTTYQSNLLNQYTQINNHSYVSVQGQAHQDATVTIQLDSTQPIKIPGDNTSGPVIQTTAGTRIAQTTRTNLPASGGGGGGSGNAAFYAELEGAEKVSGTVFFAGIGREAFELPCLRIRRLLSRTAAVKKRYLTPYI